MTMTTARLARSTTETLSCDLVRAVPLIRTARLNAMATGHEALIELDPAFVRARAGQQGLLDDSLLAAATDPRVQRMIVGAVATLNARLKCDLRIVRCRVSGPGGERLASFEAA